MRPYQIRALGLLQIADPGIHLEMEVAIPQSARQIDAVVEVAEPGAAWGPLAPLVRSRTVVVEHYRRTPSVKDLFNAQFKQLWRAEQWARTERSAPVERPRPPLLLLLSGGRPNNLLTFAWDVRPWGPRGIYLGRRSTGDIVIVDTKNLQRARGTALLRLTHVPSALAEVAGNLDWLLADAGIPTMVTDRIMEYIEMTAQMDDNAFPERVLDPRHWRRAHARGLEEGLEQGREQGLEQGLERGREQGRRALLALVERLLPNDWDELAAIEDLDELEAQLTARLTGRLAP
jgi:hypothetical protein